MTTFEATSISSKEFGLLLKQIRTVWPQLAIRGNILTERGSILIRDESSLDELPSMPLNGANISISDRANAHPIGRLNIKNTLATYTTTREHPASDLLQSRIRQFLARKQPQPTAEDRSTPRQSRKPGRHYNGDQIDVYRLIERLGSGRSGEVWSAQVISTPPAIDQLAPDSKVALKLYFPQIFSAHSETIRIQREFQAASELDHEALVKVYDVLLSPSRGYAFMAMELVSGTSLKSAIPSSGMTLKQTFEISRQLFGALNALHTAGALHRDVKAANILVEDGKPEENIKIKLCDLGIVSVVSDHELTGTSVFMGSKHSAPLEQLIGGRIDERTDIYGAASVLFHAYSGRPMYAGTGPEAAIAVRMERGEVETIRPRGEDLSARAFFDLINRCLSREPSNRPSSARAFLQELEKYSI